MARGRKAKPVEVSRRDGNPGKRKLGDPVLVGDRLIDVATLPGLPEHLEGDDEAQLLWEEVLAILVDAQIATRGDLFLVSMFVESVMESRRAYKQLRKQGSVVSTSRNDGERPSLKANPYAKVWREANAQMLKLTEQLALSPVARARLGLAIGQGRKLEKELGEGLPENPLKRDSFESTATER